MGFGVPYPGAALPRSVPKLVRAFIDEPASRAAARVARPQRLPQGPDQRHDGLALRLLRAPTARCSASASAPATRRSRAWSSSTSSCAGETNGIDTTVITEIADYFEQEIGVRIPANYPLVGRDFNVTSAGIHADGLLKNEEIYNIFDTTTILNRPIGGDHRQVGPGRHRPLDQLTLDLTGEGPRQAAPRLSKIHKWVVKQYDAGRVTTISHEEMDKLVRQYLPELFLSDLDKIKYRAAEAAMSVVSRSSITPS